MGPRVPSIRRVRILLLTPLHVYQLRFFANDWRPPQEEGREWAAVAKRLKLMSLAMVEGEDDVLDCAGAPIRTHYRGDRVARCRRYRVVAGRGR